MHSKGVTNFMGLTRIRPKKSAINCRYNLSNPVAFGRDENYKGGHGAETKSSHNVTRGNPQAENRRIATGPSAS